MFGVRAVSGFVTLSLLAIINLRWEFMKQKNFYAAFNIIYSYLKEPLGIYQKEQFYRMIFQDIYALTGDGLYDNDSIRKITSGQTLIHRRVAKKLYTENGYEIFRESIEKVCLSGEFEKTKMLSDLQRLLKESTVIPDNIKQQINKSFAETSSYQQSRAIAAILICSDKADCAWQKKSVFSLDVSFMRLEADYPPAKYPKYISDSPDAAVEELIGREEELKELYSEIVEKEQNMMISAVGGLGKTELVKAFLNRIMNTEVQENGIENVAWIPYNNQDIRLSIKQALHLSGDLEDVWSKIQDKAAQYNKKLLLIVDNIEKVKDDKYLQKLSSLPCRILLTSRQQTFPGFHRIMYLQPLKMDKCRELFYRYYQFEERDNETVNDIITLTAKLTIMIVFIAKAAYIEEMSLHQLYSKLVEKGFKLSEEDVSCEHEKLQNDDTIIRQMCILFSIVEYGKEEKILLTCISVIPNLQFDFAKAKKWFKTKKNGQLLKLFDIGMLEHSVKDRKHIYWMHSVIAAAIREQQKQILYDTASPFVHELSRELDIGEYWGKGYTKLDLIPFSWSVADLFEDHWGNEDDSVFLLRLYYVCFEASSYLLCKTLIEKVIEIDKTIQNPEMLIRDYRNYGELWLRMDETEKAIQYLNTARRYMKQIDPDQRLKREWAYLWHEYGNIYFHKGEATKAIRYYKRALKIDQSIPNLPRRELSTDYSSIAVIYQAMGELTKAYKMLTKAIEIDEKDENDSEFIMNLYYMATLCTDFVANGYDKYIPKAEQCYKTVIRFREKNLAKNSNDLADVYLEYSNFLYQIGEKTQSSYFANEAHIIYFGLYGEESYHVLQCLNNKALILWEEGKIEEALKMYRDIVKRAANMRNIPFDDVCMDYQNYADLLEHTDQYEEAMEYYKKYIRLIKQNVSENSPKLAQSYIGMANCHMGMGDYETAVKYLEKLAPFTKDDSLLERLMHHKIGTCAAFIGKDDMAADHLEKALQLCDENGILDRGYIYVDLCIIYYRMKQNDKAIFCGKEAKKFAANFKDTAFDEYVHNLDIILEEKQNI